MKPSDILIQLGDIATLAGEMAVDTRKALKTQQKEDGSLVTQADQNVERLLRETLPRLVPGTRVWGEEEGFEEPGDGGLWIVDPIDGTTNYVFGSPFWGVSIGLFQNGRIELGAIALPDLQRTYLAQRNQGAWRNGIPIQPIAPGRIREFDPISYSDTVLRQYSRDRLPGKMRYMGAWVMEAALVFDQAYRGAIAYKGNLYDIAASVCIGREIGLDIRYADGTSFEEAEILGASGLGKPVLFFPAESGFKLD